jgi:hypothetical protein
LSDLAKECVADRLVVLFRWTVSWNCVLPFDGKRALFAVPE